MCVFFHETQQAFTNLNAFLSTKNTEGKIPSSITYISATDRTIIEQITVYKYFGIWLDNALSFLRHVNMLKSKVKARLVYLYTNHTLK